MLPFKFALVPTVFSFAIFLFSILPNACLRFGLRNNLQKEDRGPTRRPLGQTYIGPSSPYQLLVGPRSLGETQYTQSNAFYHFWVQSYQNWPTCGLKLRFSLFTSKSPSASKLKCSPRSQNLAELARSKANQGSAGLKGCILLFLGTILPKFANLWLKSKIFTFY